MDDIEQAHHELDRLQTIITRHEGSMFAVRGWLLAIVGGLLAAYYTDNILISALVLRAALLLVTLMFLVVESRHVNLIESVVERATAIETRLVHARASSDPGGYRHDGPKVSEACREGAKRWWPRPGMTFLLNQPFYLVVVLVIVFLTVSLPPKRHDAPAPAPVTESPAR